MKILVFLLLLLASNTAAYSQIIISEYLKGSSNDKCIEIYNTSASPINLTGYTIQTYSNGSSTPSGGTIALSGSIASCGTYVVCNTSATTAGSADLTSGSMSFNGDDAVGLFNGATLIDLFGNIGNDPGTQWTGVGAGTANDGFVRNSSYCTAVSTDPTGTGPTSFTTFTISNWTSVGTSGATLGSHTSNCGACASNTITTGAVATSPFNVDCTNSTTASGTVAFTSIGTFNAGNTYSVEISDETGSFASPTVIGTLGSVANSGSINITIPSTFITGGAYLVRVISDNPSTTGTNSTPFTINQTNPCIPNSISTGAITGAPFTVDCSGTDDTGSIAFTSLGVYTAGNIYTAEMSDAAGSFASPTIVGTLASTANSGSISITIPAATGTGAGYLIRVVSDTPATTGTSSTAFTITQIGTCGPALPGSEGLIINEWSNGPSGNQEYYEFVVAGQCGTTVDIRGYILDDNNGTFTTPVDYSGTASGIAPGHFRFANVGQWASIPVGSLIVIYNNDDPNPVLPADDPTDANNDSLYVVPHDNALFERCLAFPQSSSPDSLYIPCTYATAPLTGWGALSLRNSGDAIQVRFPDGSYYHGVSYGGSEMSGGPHNLKLFTGGGGGMAGWFNTGDFFDASNWSSGSVAGNETPGLPNNAANYSWLLAMRDPLATTCPIVILPVEISSFTGKNIKESNVLRWTTESERNSMNFELQRSNDGNQWETISTSVASGNSSITLNYSSVDLNFPKMVNYYRLKQNDIDGVSSIHTKTVVIDNSERHDAQLIKIINILGQEISREVKGIQIHIYDDGSSIKTFKQ